MLEWESYKELIPLVVSWLLGVENTILAEGRSLTAAEVADARSVGVKTPENIRVLMVDAVAQPENPVLLKAGSETGLLGESVSGRTVGYGIEIVHGQANRALLRHEFRHVYQFESAGSRERFVTDYIKSVLKDGYFDSVYEQDARAFESY